MNKVSRLILAIALIVTTMAAMVGCSGASGGQTEKKTEITISSKDFTENMLLGKMLIKYLEYNGYPVKDETGLGASGLIRTALESGEIDSYWEYTGTALMGFMKHEPSFDAEESYNLVKKWDEENNDIIWLDYAPVNNTYCIVTTKDVMEKYNIKTISDMANCIKKGETLRFISNPEYFERADGMPQVENAYGFELPEKDRILLDLGLFYTALTNKEGELTVGFTTDGMIAASGFEILNDDKNAFPVYNATPVFRKEIIEAYPELPELVNKLSALINNETMMQLNAAVDVEEKNIDEVAENFLIEKGLIKKDK
ncbi:MAG: ABC transporter substrate-binding protein [Peptoclostridium sp.]|uniref:ABC transporter substrate-binding protein n=1 Tax=Peptoclostridium sp. TaxID=1904860 RepID=UPI00139E810C|nr:glycine betaine ABC transporter substrate-binding protein [Peptoclostridium sp.]MZQ75074.1 ABC transporter substrate-binding protein [Peptoclostridium sp.]